MNAFYAIDRRKTPMFVSFVAVAAQSAAQLVLHPASGLGSSRPGLLDRLHRDHELPDPVPADAPATRVPGIARHAGSAGQARGGLRRLAGVCWLGAHFLLADWATQPFWPKLTWLTLTIVVAGLAFLLVATALKIPELRDIIAAFERRLRRKRAG